MLAPHLEGAMQTARERRLNARIAGLRSAQPRTGRPSMAERGALRWVGVDAEERRRRMRELALRRWAENETTGLSEPVVEEVAGETAPAVSR